MHDRSRNVHSTSKRPLTTGRRPDMTGICTLRPAGVDVKRTFWVAAADVAVGRSKLWLTRHKRTFRPANVMQMKFPSLTSPQPCGAPAAIGRGDEDSGDPAAVEMQRATEGPGVLSKGAAVVGNLWSLLFTGGSVCWRCARFEEDLPPFPPAAALTTSVPRLPVFAAELA